MNENLEHRLTRHDWLMPKTMGEIVRNETGDWLECHDVVNPPNGAGPFRKRGVDRGRRRLNEILRRCGRIRVLVILAQIPSDIRPGRRACNRTDSSHSRRE